MRKFLIKKFVKDHENIKAPKVREAYGKLAGIVGIISNLFIALLKIIIGFISGSIAIIADAVNSLTDASSSIVTLLAFKLAAKEEDPEHPYGHGRFEYLAALLVSIIIIIIGIQLLLASIYKIKNPAMIDFSWGIIFALAISILVKLWQTLFNLNIGKDINSGTLIATAIDSRNDIISTAAVLASIIIGQVTGYNIDGYAGCLVAIFIIFSGFSLVKDTLDPLLGKPPNPDFIKELEDTILAYKGVLGLHDTIVHDYGPGRIFVTSHVEVNSLESLIKTHELIDGIEKEVGDAMNIELVIHMDPVDIHNPLIPKIYKIIDSTLGQFECVEDFHDLRLIEEEGQTGIVFDVRFTPGNSDREKEVRDLLNEKVKEKYPDFRLVITFDIGYI